LPRNGITAGTCGRRLLGGAARGIAFDEEELRARGILHRAVGELARQRRAGDDTLARDLLARLQRSCAFAIASCADALAGLGMLVEPQPELVLDDAGDERRRFRDDRRSFVWPQTADRAS
jgi:hypothetical protein